MIVVDVHVAVAVDDDDNDDDDDRTKATCHYLTQHIHFRQQHICATSSQTRPPPPCAPRTFLEAAGAFHQQPPVSERQR